MKDGGEVATQEAASQVAHPAKKAKAAGAKAQRPQMPTPRTGPPTPLPLATEEAAPPVAFDLSRTSEKLDVRINRRRDRAQTSGKRNEGPQGEVLAPRSALGIVGRVVYDGDVPAVPRIDFSAAPACAEIADLTPRSPLAPIRIGDDRGLIDVLVYARNAAPSGKRDSGTALRLEQCAFQRPVVATTVGVPLDFINEDNFPYVVHVGEERVPVGESKVKRTFNTAAMNLSVTVEGFPWMKSSLFVFNHPYFTTTSLSGAFLLPDGLDQSVTLVAFHPVLGEKTLEVHPRQTQKIIFHYP